MLAPEEKNYKPTFRILWSGPLIKEEKKTVSGQGAVGQESLTVKSNSYAGHTHFALLYECPAGELLSRPLIGSRRRLGH